MESWSKAEHPPIRIGDNEITDQEDLKYFPEVAEAYDAIKHITHQSYSELLERSWTAHSKVFSAASFAEYAKSEIDADLQLARWFNDLAPEEKGGLVKKFAREQHNLPTFAFRDFLRKEKRLHMVRNFEKQ